MGRRRKPHVEIYVISLAHRGNCNTLPDQMNARSFRGERHSTGIGDTTTHHNPRIAGKEAGEEGERTDTHQIQVTHPVEIACNLTLRDSKVTLRLYPETHQIVTSETRNSGANQQVQFPLKNETVAQDRPGIWSYPQSLFIIIIWFVRLLALRPLLAYCASLGW
jgi:hypothetical protein